MNYKTVLTISEYRTAVYFGLVMRIRNFLRAFAVICAAAVLYLIAGLLGWLPYTMLLNYIATVYLIVLLFQFARTEISIGRYAKSPDSMIGVEIDYQFTDTTFTVEIPALREKNHYSTDSIAAVFEQSNCFMVYITAEQTFLLPKAALSEADVSQLRTFFARHLKERFSSRFFDNATVGLERKRGLFR